MMFTRNIGRTLTSSFPDTGETSNAPFKPRTAAEEACKVVGSQDSRLGVQKRRSREAGGLRNIVNTDEEPGQL